MKRLFATLILFLCAFSHISHTKNPAHNPALFHVEVVYPLDMHGWLGLRNQHHLERFIKEHNPRRIVEVGTWLGKSALFMAQKSLPGALIYCIDPWKPYSDMDHMPDCQIRMEAAYERFLSNCIHLQLTDFIVPIQAPSLEAVRHFEDKSIDMIYIDGSHAEEDVYQDIVAWHPKLVRGGILCGDDFGWPTVKRALSRVSALLGVHVQSDDNFWWLEEPYKNDAVTDPPAVALIEHVQKAIFRANNNESERSEGALSIEGMSGAKGRHLLNNLCALDHTRYLEVGTWKGSTFIAALQHNESCVDYAAAIDNWSEFMGPRDEFVHNCDEYITAPYKLIEQDSFSVDTATIEHPITLYFYDGDHAVTSQAKAFTHFNDCFDDYFIAVVDDWVWPCVQQGTLQAFKELGYTILFEQELLTPENANPKEYWWNGLYVAVIKK